MQVPELNSDTITNLAMRAVVVQLLNLIEAQAADITALSTANQQLHDELARLKGGSGKPATDQTSTGVDGQNELCHVVGNDLFPSYHTRPGGTRQDLLAVIWGQELRYRLNDESTAWLQASSLPHTLFRQQALPSETGHDRCCLPAVPAHRQHQTQSPATAAGRGCAGGLSRAHPGTRARLAAQR